MNRKGINKAGMRKRNAGLVLSFVCRGDEVTRTAISREVGLSKMTVTNIVSELASNEYVCERKREVPNMGRHALLIDISPNAPKVIGLYIERSKITVLVTDLKIRVLFKKSVNLKDETRISITRKIYRLIDSAISSLKSNRIIGIGISASGLVNRKKGLIISNSEKPEMIVIPITDIIKKRYDLPVIVENDANAGAIAELFYGKAKNLKNFVYIEITDGVGAGIISDGRLYRDEGGFVGEIGHMSIDYKGLRCPCGNRGCIETYLSADKIYARLEEVTNSPVNYKKLDSLSENPACEAVFLDMAEKMTAMFINLSNLLAPQAIIIGNKGVCIPPKYISLIEKMLNERIYAKELRHVSILTSKFGENAAMLGSVCCVCEELFLARN